MDFELLAQEAEAIYTKLGGLHLSKQEAYTIICLVKMTIEAELVLDVIELKQERKNAKGKQ